VSLSPGQVADLPGGGSIEFVKLRQFARLQISSSPWAGIPLGATLLGVLGLVLSLSIRPRRTWVRARREGSRTVVELAALDRVRTAGLDDHLATLQSAIENSAHQGREEKA
jgi:cytochrome c biogenesis protein